MNIESIKTIIIVILGFLIGFLVLNEDRDVTYREVVKWDTVVFKSTVEVKSKPKIVDRWHPKTDTFYSRTIDTFKVVEDYLSVKVYKDTIKSGSNKIIIDDTITRNEIIGRSVRMEMENIMIKPKKMKTPTELWLNPTYSESGIGGNIMVVKGRFGMSAGYSNGTNIGIVVRLK
jgi:hypothetical protein